MELILIMCGDKILKMSTVNVEWFELVDFFEVQIPLGAIPEILCKFQRNCH